MKDRIHALLMITLGEGGLAGRAGCLAVSTAVQLGGNDAELNRLLRKRFSQTEKALVAAIEFGQACGEIRKDVSAVLFGAVGVERDVRHDRRRQRF